MWLRNITNWYVATDNDHHTLRQIPTGSQRDGEKADEF